MSGSQQERAREAKRSREAAQFFSYQKRMLRTGLPPRDEIYWSREEQLLFKGKQMTSGINFDSYDDIPVERRGGRGAEEEVQSFQDCCDKFSLSRELSDNLARCQYDKPTPVQKHSMPAALVNTDVMVSAQTGSGKTAAFLVPLISKALTVGPSPLQEGPARPTSVILAPTRELCQQITVEARKLCFRTPIRIVSIYGGADAMPQLKQMAEGCELAICTPGRLEDFLGRGVVGMENVQHLVLDEADRMLDMGFEPQIRSIVQSHNMPNPGPNGRQTMMFSATFPKEIQELALDFLDPTYLWIGVGRVGTACSNVEQRFADVSTVDDEGKFDRLVQTVSAGGEKPTKTLIFANSKAIVDDLAWRLTDQRIRTSQIHGGLTQAARDRALNDFRNGRVGVLVATDVAARGLDLPGIDHVVNYELPLNGEDYVHRIGRTGRIGNTGTATSFVGNYEPALRDIVKSIKRQDTEQAIELPVWLEQQAMRNSGGSQKRGGRGGYSRGGSAPPRGRGGYDREGSGRGGGRSYSSDRFDRPGRGSYGQGRGGYGQDRGGYGQDRGGYGRDRGGYGAGTQHLLLIMAAAAVADPVSVPTTLGTREVLDLANPVLDLQKIDNPQVSIRQCSTRFGPQALRSLFEKLAERGALASFEEINLSDNSVGDEGAAYLMKGLSGNTQLKRLTMPRADVGAKGFSAIGQLLGNSPALESLVLSSNICDAAGVEGDFCTGLGKSKSLKSLVLAACRLGDAGVEHLCAGPLRDHPTLEHICLTYNRLESATAASFNRVLAENKALRYLDLCGNSLGPEGAELLVKGLKSNKGRLQQLGLGQNGILLKGAKLLCEFFLSSEGKNMTFLDLRHNNVTYRGLKGLRDGLLGKPMDGPEGWMLLFDGDSRQLLINAH